MTTLKDVDFRTVIINPQPIDEIIEQLIQEMDIAEALIGRGLVDILNQRYSGLTFQELLQTPGNTKAVQQIVSELVLSVPTYGPLCAQMKILTELRKAAAGEALPERAARFYPQDIRISVPESSEEGGL